MITGAHTVIFSERAEEVRAFCRDVLELPFVDAGDGWLIFALPPAELAAHPSDGSGGQALYLMCDDIQATVDDLRAKGAELTRPVTEENFGLATAIALPDGSELCLYEPRHASPLGPGGDGS